MDTMTLLWTVIGFSLASYTVIANDSIQTLGTWIASNRERFNMTVLGAFASAVLVWAIWYGWFAYGGDISYGRLTKIPYIEPQWYHALAPGLLLVLTRWGIPVSTSFLVLSAFASTFVLEKMLVKSFVGYGVAAASGYAIWYFITQLFDESKPVPQNQKTAWRTAQWIVTGWLWWTWLSHDMANMAVFLPRQIPVEAMFLITILFVAGITWIFSEGGGKIQQIVLDKQNTNYVRTATLIDLVYLVILFVFKEYNNIPMSTTWVFIGLLSGRELAIASFTNRTSLDTIFPIVAKDFGKLMIGVLASMVIIVGIHTLT